MLPAGQPSVGPGAAMSSSRTTTGRTSRTSSTSAPRASSTPCV